MIGSDLAKAGHIGATDKRNKKNSYQQGAVHTWDKPRSLSRRRRLTA